nr:helitron helicase-like domain-containing protein [Tanacetum cinerariifolium]
RLAFGGGGQFHGAEVAAPVHCPLRTGVSWEIEYRAILNKVPSQVAGSTSRGLKCKSQKGNTSNVFDRYSQLCARNVFPRCSSNPSTFQRYSNLCAMDTTVLSRPTSSNAERLEILFLISDYVFSLFVPVVDRFKLRLGKCYSYAEDSQRVRLKPRHYRDDRYGCLFQQSGSVETQGSTQSGSPTLTSSKRARYNVSQRTLSSEESPSKRNRLSTLRARNTRLPKITSATGQCHSSGHIGASDTLGAIVFDSGFTESTDFDIIIKHRGGPPKRINKIHRSYMSLQFPLLFICRRSGFQTELKLR